MNRVMMQQRARLFNKGFLSNNRRLYSTNPNVFAPQPISATQPTHSSNTASVWEASARILEFAEKEMTPVTLEYLLDLSPKNPRGCALYVYNELPIRLARRVQGVPVCLTCNPTG